MTQIYLYINNTFNNSLVSGVIDQCFKTSGLGIQIMDIQAKMQNHYQ